MNKFGFVCTETTAPETKLGMIKFYYMAYSEALSLEQFRWAFHNVSDIYTMLIIFSAYARLTMCHSQ